MINIVYLVLVFYGYSGSSAPVAIPQANMAQCQVNAKNYVKERRIATTYCIGGVK